MKEWGTSGEEERGSRWLKAEFALLMAALLVPLGGALAWALLR